MVLGQHHMVGFKVFWSFTQTVGTVCKPLQSVKLIDHMSGLDPHMINKLKDENKSWFDELWVVLY
jgi:hypothetical protein